MDSKSHQLGEFELIAKLFAPLAKAPGAFRLADDAATLDLPSDRELVVTTDALVEGVHFLSHDPAEQVAKKALRVNLSDLAAKGAKPEGYLLALCVAPWVDDSWLEKFAAGLREDQKKFAVSLLGGDTTSTPGPLTLAITALGSVRKGGMIRRRGAEPRDLVFVSGTIGDAGGGLEALKGETKNLDATERAFLIARYRLPEPQLALGAMLVGLASASLDVSDGLLADLGHIADISGVRISIDASRVPLSSSLRALWGSSPETVLRAVTSGDDYEIAFTAPESARDDLQAAARETGTEIHEIGRVQAGEGVVLLDASGQPIKVRRPGFTHF